VYASALHSRSRQHGPSSVCLLYITHMYSFVVLRSFAFAPNLLTGVEEYEVLKIKHVTSE
jgi:hypothetical protein